MVIPQNTSPADGPTEEDVTKTVKLPPALAKDVEDAVKAEDSDFSKFTRRALRNELAEVRRGN